MKLILSRKGFDSTWGGYPSPILSDGQLVSLPIPQRGSGVHYSDMRIAEGLTCLELMSRLGISSIRAGRRRLKLDGALEAHLDPDLVRDHRPRPSDWRPLFGQVNQALTHLRQNSVSVGDVFLFFGWFRSTQATSERLRFIGPSSGIHAVFGYLEVGEVIDIKSDTDLPWASEHPHLRCRATAGWSQNAVFIAARQCSLVPSLPGAGVFRYHNRFVLTAPKSTRSVWQLPASFHPRFTKAPMTHHPPERWRLQGDHVMLDSAPIGQEFIVEVNDGIAAWLRDILGPEMH
jgi:hypothetical protein